ncbi:hypothetical protein [Selenomonas sp. F0473]|uniref:hypothetical protein n=1 Tax=Selenomonas sp. F0473 TaxID=999423 RepID=UPI00029E0A3F|nr:hypothetical protein [Selenomonas sp. F0473]EKU71398.1 hypothetical protein HMPREF9161_00083 [Selenomonas sp. F0473]
MKKKTNRYFAAALAAAMGLGIMASSVGTVEAARGDRPPAYENGTSNEFSFRMREEDRVHEQNMRKIRFEFRRDGDQGKYQRAVREEQKRHDQVVNKIMRDYKNNKPWHR